MNDNGVIDMYISQAEDDKTAMEKTNIRKNNPDKRHATTTLLQKGFGLGRTVATAARRLFQQVQQGSTKRARFANRPAVQTYEDEDTAIMITYDSGSDGNYLSEADRNKLGLPILRQSTRRVGVANGEASKGKFVTKLPFPQLSPKAAEADTFDDFKTSLMSVGRTSDDGFLCENRHVAVI